MTEHHAHVGSMETQLQHWGAKLDALAGKAEAAGAEAKGDYHDGIADLKVKYEVARTKLLELKAAGIEKRGTFKAGVENAWNELEIAFEKIAT